MKWVLKGFPFVVFGFFGGGVILAGIILGSLLLMDKKEKEKQK